MQFGNGLKKNLVLFTAVVVLSVCISRSAFAGDLNEDCRVDFGDFAAVAENWLIDCRLTQQNPACIPE